MPSRPAKDNQRAGGAHSFPAGRRPNHVGLRHAHVQEAVWIVGNQLVENAETDVSGEDGDPGVGGDDVIEFGGEGVPHDLIPRASSE